MFNSIHKFTLLVGITAGLLSCGDDHNDTGTEFAPNMYNSVGYEPMTQLQGHKQNQPIRDEHAFTCLRYGTS